MNFENEENKPLDLQIEISKKIDMLNPDFDFAQFINEIFTEEEKLNIEENYLNEKRFNSIFEETEHFYFKYIMGYLQYNSDQKNIINGLRETMKLIKSNRAKLVYIANDCEIEEYENLLKELCVLNFVNYVIVPKWTYLRDVLFKGVTTNELKSIAKESNKKIKIQPKCNCAAVLFSEKEQDEYKANLSEENEFDKKINVNILNNNL